MEKMDAYSLYLKDIETIENFDDEEMKILFYKFDKLNKIFKEKQKVCNELLKKLRKPESKLDKETKEKEYNEKNKELREIMKDHSAFHDLILEKSLRLVLYVIDNDFKFLSSNDLMDVIQEGNIALSNAINNYDYSLGYKFSSYACKCISGRIKSYLLDNKSIVRIPRNVGEKINKLKRLEEEYEVMGLELTDEEICKNLDIKLVDVKNIKKSKELITSMMSLERMKEIENYYEDNELYQKEKIIEKDEEIPEKLLDKEYIREFFDKCFSFLTPKEQTVLKLRFGLEDGIERSLEEVGYVYDYTRKRVRQIEEKALRKLRRLTYSRMQ